MNDDLLGRAEAELAAESGPSGMHYGDSTKRELYEALRACDRDLATDRTVYVDAIEKLRSGGLWPPDVMSEAARAFHRSAVASVVSPPTSPEGDE